MKGSTGSLPWIHTTNIYEVNTRQYTTEGSFNAFALELPRLRDMGVETLWFMPITPIAQKNKKGTIGSPYACSDYVSVNPELGTLDDFKKLVEKAKALGFKVIIDWVANHTGWDHVWTIEHPEFYKRDEITGDFKTPGDMEDIIELDFDNSGVATAMIAAMKFWIDQTGIDGFRCDLAGWVRASFWERARQELDAIRPLAWLGEFDALQNPEHAIVFDISYTWLWMHETENFYKNHLTLSTLESLLQRYSELGDTAMRAWFTSNHDENSWNGTEYEKYGNMAKALAVFSCTWNGVPLLYSGQEMPLLAKRLAFFEKDPIPWTGKYELQDFYRCLLQLHASNPALRGGDSLVSTLRTTTSADDKAFVYRRQKGEHEVLVVLNFSPESPLVFSVTDQLVTGIYKNVFTGELKDMDAYRDFTLQAWDYLVFEKVN